MQIATEISEFEALIRLLDDPDDGIYQNISNRLIAFGKTAIPYLEYEWESSLNDAIQERIVEIIHEIQFDHCKLALTNWVAKGSTDLLEGALLVSMYQYPDMETDHLYEQIELLRKDVWIELNDELTSLEKVRVMNHIIYRVHDFRPHLKHQGSLQGLFLKNVLELHHGNPTSLAVFYMVLAEKLELPIVGVDLPGHFVLGYVDVNQAADTDILFYINPFSKGSVFGKGELVRYLEKMELDMASISLKPISNIKIIRRMLLDTANYFQKQNNHQKIKELGQLLSILKLTN